MAGVDMLAGARLRGQTVTEWFQDEAGFIDDLDALIEEVIRPTFVTTGGRLWLLSTPPRIPDHPFRDYVEEASLKGAYFHQTYRDNPRTDPGELKRLMEKEGIQGEDDVRFRREFLADLNAFETDHRVIKSFRPAEHDEWFATWVPPRIMRHYVCIDPGSKDATGIIFASYDWRSGVMVIEDELVLTNPDTKTIADAITAKEKALWGELEATHPDTRRYSDHELLFINDLRRVYGLKCNKAIKRGTNIGMVNVLDGHLGKGEIRVHPRCVNLRLQLTNGMWRETRGEHRDYERTRRLSHLDALDAAKYLAMAMTLPGVTRENHPHPDDPPWDPPEDQAERSATIIKLPERPHLGAPAARSRTIGGNRRMGAGAWR